MRRLMCARWWVRALRRAAARRCEGAAIRGALVRRDCTYTAGSIARRGEQKRRNEAAVAGAALVDLDNGEEVELAEIVAGSLANPPTDGRK